jgi:hypothetical protein
MTRMRNVNVALITIGSVLIAIVVIGLLAGAVQDAELAGQVGYRPDDGGLVAGQVVFLILGSLMVLVGVIQHAMDRRK